MTSEEEVSEEEDEPVKIEAEYEHGQYVVHRRLQRVKFFNFTKSVSGFNDAMVQSLYMD
jgi:hypothetical protein